MTNLEFQHLLQNYPDTMPIRILVGKIGSTPMDFTEEHVLYSSETAHINPDADPDTWDTEDGKIELGNGQRYLLINPIIY